MYVYAAAFWLQRAVMNFDVFPNNSKQDWMCQNLFFQSNQLDPRCCCGVKLLLLTRTLFQESEWKKLFEI